MRSARAMARRRGGSRRRSIRAEVYGFAALLGAACAVPLAVIPARAQDWDPCRAIRDGAARAGCADAVKTAGSSRARSEPTSVRAIAGPDTLRAARPVDWSDIIAKPASYIGRPVLVRVGSCRYVDVYRYICTAAAAAPAEIRALVVVPPAAQVVIEAGRAEGSCGSGGRRRCRDLVRFVPNAVRETGGGTISLSTTAIRFVGR